MTKTNVSWPLFAFLGILGLGGAVLAPACTVTTGDGDDIDVDAGVGGTSSSGGSQSSGGSAGSSAGSGGSSAGSGGSSAGSGGSSAGSGGSAGSAGSGSKMACGDQTVIAQLTCEPIEGDPCDVCVRTNCCEEWKECFASDDTAGDHVCGWGDWGGDVPNGEIGCIIACMTAGAASPEDCAGECMASAWEDSVCTEGTVTNETNALIGCIVDPETTCEAECFVE